MFRQNRESSPDDVHAQRMEQRAIAGQAYDQRADEDPYAPRRLDSFRAHQGQPVAGAGQQDQPPPAEALTPRRRLDSFRQQQGQPVAPVSGGLASPPNVPALGLGRMSDAGQLGSSGSLNTDRGVPLSTRRLKKEVLRAEPNPHSEPCLLYTSPSPRDQRGSRMPSSA